MEQYKAIPPGYMTVGELAKKMGVTVRTLQYYDKKGLLSPSAESEGGRRLYTDRDLIRLYQIVSLKHLGFSLEDIKNKVISLDSPEDVANVLSEQAADLRRKIQSLTQAYEEILLLREEVLQIQSVDFKKYADIIVNLQMKNEFYWLVKHFDDQTLDYLRGRFDKESGMAFMRSFKRLNDSIAELHKHHVPPDSEEAQALAKLFWDMIVEFTGGDMSMLPKLMEMGSMEDAGNELAKKQALNQAYMEQMLDVYFTRLGMNPFTGDLPE
ncbi:MerR family transcriptional regulator [Anaerolentibacter hominis]|uniref:MerR family transcriptional regulator n=1 Tax=Anaerolentibacter hominis TaxID=3079009 RepID=UPI0031B7F91F